MTFFVLAVLSVIAIVCLLLRSREGLGAGQVSAQIVGGFETKGYWPWFVRVYSDMGMCGGVLMREDVVLTAAHCIQKTTYVRCRVGDVDIKAVSWLLHPDYSESTDSTDIAVIFLGKIAGPASTGAQGKGVRLYLKPVARSRGVIATIVDVVVQEDAAPLGLEVLVLEFFVVHQHADKFHERLQLGKDVLAPEFGVAA